MCITVHHFPSTKKMPFLQCLHHNTVDVTLLHLLNKICRVDRNRISELFATLTNLLKPFPKHLPEPCLTLSQLLAQNLCLSPCPNLFKTLPKPCQNSCLNPFLILYLKSCLNPCQTIAQSIAQTLAQTLPEPLAWTLAQTETSMLESDWYLKYEVIHTYVQMF